MLEAANRIAELLRDDDLIVELDDRDLRPGAKYFEWERKGVPLRLELGPRDLDEDSVMAKLRIAEKDERGRPVKLKLPLADIGVEVGKLLDGFQDLLFQRAKTRMEENTVVIDTWDEFKQAFADGQSRFVYDHWDGTNETEAAIKEETKATIRCLPHPEDCPAAAMESADRSASFASRRSFTSCNRSASSSASAARSTSASAQRSGWEGTVLLLVHVRTDGTVDHVEVLRSSGRAVLDREALRAVSGWRFTPALERGTPAAARVEVPVRFRI